MKKWCLFVFLIILASSVSAYTQLGGNVCSCNACSDCNSALTNTSCSAEVQLTVDINDNAGSCINFSGSNLMLNCQNYKIDGTDSAGTYGVLLSNVNGNTVKNCRISDFYNGVYIEKSNNNRIEFNDITSNADNGVNINASNGNTVINNNMTNNAVTSIATGVYIYANSFSNTVESNTISSNIFGVSLTNAQNTNINKNTIKSNQKNGIELYTSNTNMITYNIIELNLEHGMKITSSSGNVMSNNNITQNTKDGINSTSSTSAIDYNKICNNTLSDMSFDLLTGNLGDNNICTNYGLWKDTTASAGCKTTCSGNQTCSDGTVYDSCSSTVPQYCDNGNLVSNCTSCGCPSGQTCNSTLQTCSTVQACSDNTAYSSCSSDKPLYCDAGSLVDKCETCGCDGDDYCDSNGQCRGLKSAGRSCVSGNECKSGQCSDGVCTAEEGNGECTEDEDCGSLKYCKNELCLEKKDLGEDCSRDAECNIGFCDGECVECNVNNDCSEEQVCSNEECVKLECAGDEVIRDHACFVPECDKDSECEADEECSRNECKIIDCFYGDIVEHYCEPWACREDTDCKADFICDSEKHECVKRAGIKWLFGVVVSLIIMASGLMFWQQYQKKKRWPLK